ncbi:SDR family NAD(P)-dependent oxidoreductase [Tateyamaria sp. SN6-1]|uniref:SDR family NAD(P)-dependent oxidoreductase n=1 Tax=Tateyamaria sp. SN6-1 TaxID=3092148 RepID=UPI0039F603FD
MAHHLITGAALLAQAVALGHRGMSTARDRRDGTVPLALDTPGPITAQLAGIGPLGIPINSIAPLAVAQAILLRLRQSAAPKILTMSPQMAWMGYRIACLASKAAVNTVMQRLASGHEPQGVPVALVGPARVRTDMGAANAEGGPRDMARGMTPKDAGGFVRFKGQKREFQTWHD